MAQVVITHSDLSELATVTREEAIGTLTMLGFPTEELADGGLNVEVTPNRPDALCVEGIARALNSYKSGKPPKYTVGKPKVNVVVDKSVSDVRPVFGCAAVLNVKMTESLLRSLMQLQEKLHETLGRKRRKVAIGIHDMDKVVPPFRYFACGRKDVSFVPLDREAKMTPDEILENHEKGIGYAHLVGERCPMITDRNGSVLSFPPIINGELTKLTRHSKNLFIDATGTSPEAVRQAVNIIVAALLDRGGQAEEVLVGKKPYRLLEEKRMALPVCEAERLLGIKLGKKKCGVLLAKMGHRVVGGSVFVPGYRTDVISAVDLVEDIAIAYGFNNFEPTLPSFASIGKASAESPYHDLLVGLGFDETVTWTLSNREMAKKALLPQSAVIEIENPLTADFTAFRSAILPNLLTVLFESKNERLPVRIYEIGPVGAPDLEGRLAAVSMHPKASLSEIIGIVLSLAEATGRGIEVKPEDFGPFLKGRCAALYVDGKKKGFAGEISPQVLANFGLEQPACAFEIGLDW